MSSKKKTTTEAVEAEVAEEATEKTVAETAEAVEAEVAEEATEKTVAETAETPAETAEEKAVTAETEAAGTKTAKPLMYVGPTLTGIAIQNRVYTEIPESAAAMIAKDKELRNLFIPVAQYPKANKMIREEKGYIYRAYLKALKLKK